MVPNGWVLPAIVERIVDFGEASGLPRERLEAMLGGRGGAAIPGDAAHQVLAYVVRELDDPSAVWQLAARARPGDYGPYGFVLQASDTVGDALARAARFFSTIATTAEMTLSTGPKTTRILVRRRDGATSRGAELGTQYIVAQIMRLIAAITGEAVGPRAIRLQHSLDQRAPREIATGPGANGSAPATSIEIDRATLDLPLPRRDPDLAHHFETDLRRREDPSPSALARRALYQALSLGRSTSEDDIARALKMGSRTMRRRLAEERTTLRELFDAVRLDMVTERLQRSGASLAQIAYELGFSDQTALSRAFRRWTGRSPAEYRRSMLR